MMKRCLPPFAWTAFSLKYPDQALVRPGHLGSRDDLARINARVNRLAFASGPQPNPEVWLIWPQRAWCHDYAVTKRHDLLREGWPSSSLLLALCFTDRGEGHCVLIANGLVMDNQRAELVPKESTGYRWDLPIQQADDPHHWERWQ